MGGGGGGVLSLQHIAITAFFHTDTGLELIYTSTGQNKTNVSFRAEISFYFTLCSFYVQISAFKATGEISAFYGHVMLWLKFGDVVDSLSVRDRGHAEDRRHGTRRWGSTYVMQMENKNI